MEAKSGSTFTDHWGKGLRAVVQLKGLTRRIIVYPRGPVLRTKGGIDGLPFPALLRPFGRRQPVKENMDY